MFVDESDRGFELLSVAIEPVRLVDGWVCRFEAERKHSAVRQRVNQRFCDGFRGLQVFSDDGRVAVVGVKYAQALVLPEAVEQPGDGFWVWYRVLQLLNAFRHVGVGVGHAAQPHVPNAGIVSDANLLDDVLRFSPNRDALLWFDAKLATTFVPDAALVHLDFVG